MSVSATSSPRPAYDRRVPKARTGYGTIYYKRGSLCWYSTPGMISHIPGDHAYLGWFEPLVGKHESWDTLPLRTHFMWRTCFEVCDTRENHISTWVLDTDCQRLLWMKHKVVWSVPLSLVTERCLIPEDFTLLKARPLNTVDPVLFSGPHWEIPISPEILRKKSLCRALMQEFVDTRASLFRYPQSRHTVLRICHILVQLAALNFWVSAHLSIRKRRQSTLDSSGPHYHAIDFDSDFLKIGRCIFHICPNINTGIATVLEHAEPPPSNAVAMTGENNTQSTSEIHLIMTQDRVVALRLQAQGPFQLCKPEELFDQGQVLREPALNLLLWATETTQPVPPPTRLHRLPLELQDMIIRFTWLSDLAAAHISCTMKLGTASSGFTRADCGARLALPSPGLSVAPAAFRPPYVLNEVFLGLDTSVLWYRVREPYIAPVAKKRKRKAKTDD